MGLFFLYRRLHDVNIPPYVLFVVLLGYAGIIVLICLFCLKSAPDNRYGPNPYKKEEEKDLEK